MLCNALDEKLDWEGDDIQTRIHILVLQARPRIVKKW